MTPIRSYAPLVNTETDEECSSDFHEQQLYHDACLPEISTSDRFHDAARHEDEASLVSRTSGKITPTTCETYSVGSCSSVESLVWDCAFNTLSVMCGAPKTSISSFLNTTGKQSSDCSSRSSETSVKYMQHHVKENSNRKQDCELVPAVDTTLRKRLSAHESQQEVGLRRLRSPLKRRGSLAPLDVNRQSKTPIKRNSQDAELQSSAASTSSMSVSNSHHLKSQEEIHPLEHMQVLEKISNPYGLDTIRDLLQRQRFMYIHWLQSEVYRLEQVEAVLADSKFSRLPRNLKLRDGKVSNPLKKRNAKLPSLDPSHTVQHSLPNIRTDYIEKHVPMFLMDDGILHYNNVSVAVQTEDTHVITNSRQGAESKENSDLIHALQLRPEKSSPNIQHSVAWYIPWDGKSRSCRLRQPCVYTDQNEHLGSIQDQHSLQSAMKIFRPQVICNVMARQEKIKALRKSLPMNKYRNPPLKEQHCLYTKPLSICGRHHKPEQRNMSHHEIRNHTERLYQKLPEVYEERQRKIQGEQYRLNHQQAHLFTKKLKENVLRGKVSMLITEKCT